MTVYLIVAGLLALVALTDFGQQPSCVACGGKGAHRPGCPDE